MDGHAERRIPVQYAKRVVGRKMYGGQSTHIPIKVNMCGVLPIIFASSILSLPPTIQMFVTVKEGGFWAGFFKILNNSLGIRNYVLCVDYILRIFLCSHSVQSHRNGEQHPQEQRCHPRHSSRQAHVGLYHQDIVKTYIARCSSSVGSCAFPLLFSQITGAFHHQVNLSLGGTSIIIMVGVALETVKQLESQMMMRHYKGFLD